MNKRQIKQLLSEKLQSRIEEESLDKKGRKKLKGRKQRLNVKSSKDYAKKLAPIIIDELVQEIQKMDSSFEADSKVVKELEQRLLSDGVKFDDVNIKSTELNEVDFSSGSLVWQSNRAAIRLEFQFPVTGTSFVINPEFGDLDERTGKFVHTITFKYSRPQEALTVIGLDTVFKGA